MELDSIYTELISEHSRSTEHKHHLECPNMSLKGRNPSCGDEITLELQVEDGYIKDASFVGIGCAISQASTSIMIDLIKGESVAKARHLANLFLRMIKREELTEDEEEEQQLRHADVWEAWDSNVRIHLQLCSFAQNRYCQQMLESSMGILKRAYAQFYLDQQRTVHKPYGNGLHMDIVDRLLAGDVDGAEAALREDICSFEKLIFML